MSIGLICGPILTVGLWNNLPAVLRDADAVGGFRAIVVTAFGIGSWLAITALTVWIFVLFMAL